LQLPPDGRKRVVIEGVEPEIDGGRFGIKRTVGELVRVRATAFADGHDLISCRLLFRSDKQSEWTSAPMAELGNDRWVGEFRPAEIGRCFYTVEGWVDRFKTWRADLKKRIAASQDIAVELRIGSGLVEAAAARATGSDRESLRHWASLLKTNASVAFFDDLFAAMRRCPELALATRYDRQLLVTVDRLRARFSTWYEMFPRSATPEPGAHGTFRDCITRLPYVVGMGFDILYLPPVHPIGSQFRKGRNNATTADPDDVGSPWAIGDETGGFTELHPKLGTIEDFQALLVAARERNLEIALDIAFQCSPDHPWVQRHPEWFRKRPDGSIQYAENPPKKYQDVYPLDFETPAWRELWDALREVFEFWIEEGVRVFRVDNPHTKAFPFWEWVIGSIREAHPDVIFLAEAFTRPFVMYRLAKLGFTQSYTYFTWRNTKEEITAYFTELSRSLVRDFFRANLWPNTPDILSEALQVGGRSAFMVRLLLAATLGANYGIYGPAFELIENTPKTPGSEEYLDSEKYEIRRWNLDSPNSLQHVITRINHIRRENPALQGDSTLVFHETDNPDLICYSKTSEDLSNIVIVVVNLDWARRRSGWVSLDMAALGLAADRSFEAEDLLSGGRFLWKGKRDYVELVPETLPGHILRVRRWSRTEKDFDYYL